MAWARDRAKWTCGLHVSRTVLIGLHMGGGENFLRSFCEGGGVIDIVFRGLVLVDRLFAIEFKLLASQIF